MLLMRAHKLHAALDAVLKHLQEEGFGGFGNVARESGEPSANVGTPTEFNGILRRKETKFD